MSHRQDNFFTEIGNTKPYLKCAFEGFAGTGKTYTIAQIAAGLHKRIQSTKPIIIFDTEEAAKFLKRYFRERQIAVLVRPSRQLADLKETMARMRAGISDILIIDSISHVWEKYLEAYQEKVRRTRLEFQDWGVIKPTWKAEFSDPFVKDPYHVLMSGRAGYEYENEKNEETGKREIFKSGVKMKVEGETAYEPDVLVLMERFEEVLGRDKSVWREATILKDRSGLIDGKTFKNPAYDHFSPMIEDLLADPVAAGAASPEGNTQLLFKTEEQKVEWKRDRDAALEEIDGLLDRAYPGSTGKDRQMKSDILDQVFGTSSETAIKQMRIEALREGWKKIAEILVARGVAEWNTASRRLEMKSIPTVTLPSEVVPTPVSEQTIAAGPTAYEQITPIPLREAHKGLDKLALEELWDKSSFAKVKSKTAKAMASAAKELAWTPEQYEVLLATMGAIADAAPSTDQINELLPLLARGPEAVLPKEVFVATEPVAHATA